MITENVKAIAVMDNSLTCALHSDSGGRSINITATLPCEEIKVQTKFIDLKWSYINIVPNQCGEAWRNDFGIFLVGVSKNIFKILDQFA